MNALSNCSKVVDSVEKLKEKVEKEEDEHYNRREYNYTSWSRSFSLPENCNRDMIDAEYKNGELRIFIPKLEVKKPKNVQKISVS